MPRKDQCWRCDTICSAPTAKIYCGRCGMVYYCSNNCKRRDEFRYQVGCQTVMLKRKCSGCGKEKTGLKTCGNCRQSWYCNKECQKKSRPTYKAYFQLVKKAISDLSRQLKSEFDIKASMNLFGCCLYYWGNTPAMDLINLPLNEGCDYSKPLSVLACGVGYSRNVVLSLAQFPEAYQEELTFVFYDICACTLARTVVILYLLFKGKA